MKNILIAVFGLVLIVSTTSCRREKDTNAIITVVNATEDPVVGATVKLYIATPTGAIRDGIEVTETTNSSGVASFNFNDLYELGQAGFAVLDVDVNSGAATGIIKIEEETDSEQTIVCQTC